MDGADNPFASPTSSDSVTHAGDLETVQVSDRVIELLARTRPWVAAVVLFGGIVLLILVLGLLLLMMFATSAIVGPREPWLLVVGIYGANLTLYGVPLVYLFRFARNIGRLTNTRDLRHLEAVLESQRKFWKWVFLFWTGSSLLCILFLLFSRLLTGERVG